jgi:hypothetical protein
MQVFDQTAGGPALTLDAAKNKITFTDFVGDKCNGACPAVALNSYTGRTTLHSMQITFGAKGKIAYKVTDAATGTKIIEYNATGKLGSNAT